MQNSQAVKNGAALKILGEKCCEIKDGGQEIPTKTLRNVYGHFLATTFDITTFFTQGCTIFYSLAVFTWISLLVWHKRS